MRKTLLSIGGALALVILVGAGCGSAAEPSDAGNTAGIPRYNDTNTPTAENTKDANTSITPSDADFRLSAEALGNMEVKLSWNTSRSLDESNRFIIVRGNTENPELDGKHYWIRQYHTVREAVWKQESTGPMHFRVCTTENNEKDTCVSYSNDVMVDVE